MDLVDENLPDDLTSTKNDDLAETVTCEKCFGCKKDIPHLELYRCVSCDANSNMESNEQQLISKRFCVMCIVSHLRQKHEIVDHRGHVPYVCPQHECLSLLFCNECQSLCCYECIKMHLRHNLEDVSEKASEVKKSVFELWTKHDETLKTLKRKCHSAQLAFDHVSSLDSQLSSDNVVQTLLKLFDEVIRDNAEKWVSLVSIKTKRLNESSVAPQRLQDSVDEIKEGIAVVENNIQSFQKLMQLSDGVCISDFVKSEERYKADIQGQTGLMNKKHLLKWTKSLKLLAVSAIEEMLNSLEMPKENCPSLYRRSFIANTVETSHLTLPSDEKLGLLSTNGIPRAYVDDSTESCYDWSSDLLSTSLDTDFSVVEVAKFDEHPESIPWELLPMRVKVVKVKFSHPDILRIFRFKRNLALYLKDSSVLIYSLASLTLVTRFEMDVNLTPLKLYRCETKFDFIIWDSKRRRVGFSYENADSEGIPCQSCPELVDYRGSVLAFADNMGQITIYDRKIKSYLKVLPCNHGLFCVNKLAVDENILRLWDYQTKCHLRSSFSFKSKKDASWTSGNHFDYKIPIENDVNYFDRIRQVKLMGFSGDCFLQEQDF